MNLPTTAFTALLVSAGHKVIQFTIRFLRDAPASTHEQRIFAHLNGLVDAVANQLLNRTFAPTGLQAV